MPDYCKKCKTEIKLRFVKQNMPVSVALDEELFSNNIGIYVFSAFVLRNGCDCGSSTKHSSQVVLHNKVIRSVLQHSAIKLSLAGIVDEY